VTTAKYNHVVEWLLQKKPTIVVPAINSLARWSVSQGRKKTGNMRARKDQEAILEREENQEADLANDAQEGPANEVLRLREVDDLSAQGFTDRALLWLRVSKRASGTSDILPQVERCPAERFPASPARASKFH
jgi:hypothetical protein